MSDEPVYMDFEEPHPYDSAPKKPKKPKKGKKDGVPRLPERQRPLTGDEIRRGVSDRNRSATNLKVEGYSYQEIAEMLEFETPADAKKAVESTLAAIHDPGEYESLRLIVVARAEKQMKRSMAMADAHFLVLEDGTQVANTQQLAWHQAAGTDLMNWAALTGTKLPTKVEFTPGEADMERLLAEIVRRQGHEDILDAEVIELDAIEAPVEDWDDDGTPQG